MESAVGVVCPEQLPVKHKLDEFLVFLRLCLRS